jgi:hypothetical protein
MRIIKVTDLKIGMIIWCPGSTRVHKKTIIGVVALYRSGITVIFGEGDKTFFHSYYFIQVIEPKLSSML